MITSEKQQDPILHQASLFGDGLESGVAINDAALAVGVSSATIRNWVKTGYLKQDGSGYVSAKSFDHFRNQVAGTEKLTSRANKSLKDSHDHSVVSAEFILKLAGNARPADSIANDYEDSLSESFRNKEGIYYTPPNIVSDLLEIQAKDISSKIFCDPCCGSGNFVMRAIELGFKPENVFGYDTDPVAVAFTKKRIFDRTGYDSNNVTNADFLERASQIKQTNFDYIYTNPPWGKKLLKTEREKYGFLFHSGKSIDTCSLFFFACLNCLKKGGELGLLLPESFFNIATFEDARLKTLSLDVKKLTNYEKPFKGLVTKALAIVLANQLANCDADIICRSEGKQFVRSMRSFVANPKSILNFHCDSNASEVIEHILSIPHITLEGNAKWGLGIVTGNNKKFLRSSPSEGYIPVIRGADIKKNRISDPQFYLPADLSLYQQVAPEEMYEAKTKLIYKFISTDLCFFCDTEQRYVINSANMLVPSDHFPLSADQLCSILNSDFINWVFKSLFNTHKILRGDLESLPIHSGYFDENNYFDEDSFLSFLHLEKHGNGTYRIKS